MLWQLARNAYRARDEEDDAVNARHVRMALGHRKVQWVKSLSDAVDVTRLSDGTELLSYLPGEAPFNDRSVHAIPDLVLLDQRMPRLDGIDALRVIRGEAQLRHVPVCMLSPSDQRRLVQEAYATGANFYLVKPYELEELQRVLKKIVDFFRNVATLPAAITAS